MAQTLIEDARGDVQNAAALARAAHISYAPADSAVPQFREELRLEARLFSRGNTQAYVATNAEHIVVAFRGTEAPTHLDGFKDWLLTDAADLLIEPRGPLGTELAAAGVGARFHKGFAEALTEIWEPVYQAVDAEMRNAERPLWLTGHSLGGALALLAGWVFLRRTTNVHQIYTFGGPMIGNELAARAFEERLARKVFRYVNAPDPVPKLPTFSLLGNKFCHCPEERLLGAADSEADFLQQFAQRAVDGILHAALVDAIWNALHERISAHGIGTYRTLLATLAQP